MREKKWIDCPVCGSKKSMRIRKNLHERAHLRDYPPLDIDGLDGQFCKICDEGFWSLKSERRIERLLAEHMAKHDSARVVAAEIASVQEAANALQISVQGVHKMMTDGRLKFVFAAGRRLPIRQDIAAKAKKPGRTSARPRN